VIRLRARAVLAAVRAAGDDAPAEGMSVAYGLDRHGKRPSQLPLDFREQKENNMRSESRVEATMDAEKKSAWLRKLDEECPYQVVLPRRQLADDSEILNFLIKYVGKFDMYVEDDYAAFVRYCFEDPLDAEIFRSRFEPKAERFRLAG
jgi:hypothetical protein